ncbi:uncharacterized protein LOC123675432 [Harmonia axyridis]|uniref:uncharacterized protein LOC123675432 n=1 Tax=Harmonia axyridis TaxID=115357 RepID=UPI001E275E19|nr:uncharacterized protein LOC123675432 [Harmonia axyridis]
MNRFAKIFCSIVLFEICHASTNTLPLKQFEGSWTIRNASENALPIIGKCPVMHIEPSSSKNGNDGIILWRTSIQTLTLSLVNVNQETFQLFYRNNSRNTLLGNVSVLHVEKSTYLITKVQTPGQTYYAVLTKDNETSPDTDMKIEKWNSSAPNKNITLEPVENENCQEVNEETPMNEPIDTTNGSSMLTTTERVSNSKGQVKNKPLSNHQEISTEKKMITPNVTNDSNTDINNIANKDQSVPSTHSTPISSEGSWKKAETLPIVGTNDTKKYKAGRGSGTAAFPSNVIVIINIIFFLINNVFIHV